MTPRSGVPGEDPDLPERLGQPRIPDPRDDTLIHECLADEPSGVVTPQTSDDVPDLRLLGEQVGTELTDSSLAPEREHRSVPLSGLPLAAPKHEPRRPATPRVSSVHPPASRHAEMAPYDNSSFEAQHEVLPDRLDVLEPASVDRSSHAGDEPARIRALRLEALADEHLQLPRDSVEGIPLGHVAQRSSAPASSTSAPKMASENVG